MKKRKPFLKLLAWFISLTLLLGVATAMAEDAPAPDIAEPGAATDAPPEAPPGDPPTEGTPAEENPTFAPGAFVTFTVAGEALYLEAGVAASESDLLAGVTAADESGAPVAVTLADADGLTPEDPQPREAGDAATGLTPLPYVLTYTATHPTSGAIFTQTRECYVAAAQPGAAAITFTIEGEALYLEAGVAASEGDLLAGVTAVDETGAPVAVTLADADGLTPENPQPREAGDPATGLTPLPYVLTYTATHPTTGAIFTQTRECYVAVPIKPLAGPDASTFDLSTGLYKDGSAVGTSDTALDVNKCYLERDTYFWVMDGADITVTGISAVGSANEGPRRIVVAAGATAKITLSGATINLTGAYQTPIALGPGATLTLVLEGTNRLVAGDTCAAIQTTDATLIIDSETGGALEAQGGDNGPGPGDGTGAGIGGSGRGDGGTVTICGSAIVTAVGGRITSSTLDGAAAGIGGGGGGVEKTGGNGGTIIIEGSAQVTATGGNGPVDGGGAGIGGGGGGTYTSPAGVGGSVKEIIIRGGATVTAKGGSGGTMDDAKGGGGAGIGGGGGGFSLDEGAWPADGGGGGTITIITTGGVSATGGSSNSYPGSPVGTGGGANNQGANPTGPILWINAKPEDKAVDPGVPVTLSVAAIVVSPDGTGTEIKYQWYSNTTLSDTGGTSISGATGASFTVPTGAAGTFYYFCRISADGASSITTNVATVTVSTYIITANISWPDFGSERSPYAQPDARTVTITSTGTGAVTLVLPTSTKYIIGAFSPDGVLSATDDTATFTVQPRAGLPVGEYNETLTINGNDGASATVELTFQVTPKEPEVTFAVRGSGVNLAKPADLVFEVDDAALLAGAGLTFDNVRFTRVTPSPAGPGEPLGTTYGVIYDNGLVTIPAALFGQHNSGQPLIPGTYHAIIEFTYGGNDSYEYGVDLVFVNSPDYSVVVNGGDGDGDYEAGERVTITAVVPTGEQFVEWQVDAGTTQLDDASKATTSFTMPTHNVEVTALYEKIPDPPPPPPTPPQPTPPSHSGGDSGPTYKPPVADAWLDPGEARPLAAAAKRQGLDFANTSRTERYGVRGKAWAELRNLNFYHDTVGNGLIRVRLYVDDPALFTKDAYVSGYTFGKGVDAAREVFEKWFVNPVRVVHFDQAGEWERTVQAAALVDLKGMDASKLHFYAYDIASNVYRPLMLPMYWVDAGGYLHFSTPYAGDIVISEGPLLRK